MIKGKWQNVTLSDHEAQFLHSIMVKTYGATVAIHVTAILTTAWTLEQNHQTQMMCPCHHYSPHSRLLKNPQSLAAETTIPAYSKAFQF
jgi:hypothetical protein